jgi:hypothetical protein
MPVLGSVPFIIKQGDTRDYIRVPLQGSDGTAPNLAGATVAFNMKQSKKVIIDHGTCFIIDVPTATVEYRWQTADVTGYGSDFEGEFEVTYSDSTIQTFPNDVNIPIYIVQQVD